MKTIFNFLFPNDNKLKVESTFEVSFDRTKNKYVVRYRFYTLRSIVAHLWGAGFVVPFQKMVVICKERPMFAFNLALLFFYFIQNLKGVSNVSGLVLAGGAIAYDTSNSGSISAATLDVAITPTGANRVMVAGYSSTGTPSADATFNSISMTAVSTFDFYKTGRIWRLVAPSTGTHNLSVSNSASTVIGMGGVNFTGANQITPDDGENHDNAASATSISVSVTTGKANTFVFACGSRNTNGVVVDSGSQTSRWSINPSSFQFMGATLPTTSPGSYAMGWSLAGSDFWQMEMVGVAEVASTETYNFFQFF